jgi:hypothetical protein
MEAIVSRTALKHLGGGHIVSGDRFIPVATEARHTHVARQQHPGK